VDEEIPFVFYGGDEPPSVATPTGTWVDRAAACKAIRSATEDLCRRAAQSNADLRTVSGSHPVFGRMDGVQWLIFGFAHIERHRADLRPAQTGASA
jgi:hypothetical protein